MAEAFFDSCTGSRGTIAIAAVRSLSPAWIPLAAVDRAEACEAF